MSPSTSLGSCIEILKEAVFARLNRLSHGIVVSILFLFYFKIIFYSRIPFTNPRNPTALLNAKSKA